MKIKKRGLISFFLILVAVCSAQTKNKTPTWSITATKFTLKGVPDLYASYATELPAMLNLFCAVPADRLVTPEETKMRKIMDDTSKKLALIRERIFLINERDGLYLAVLSESDKQKKTASINKKIEAKEKEILKAQEKIDSLLSDTSFAAETLPVSFWQEGAKVFEQPEHTDLAQALKTERISAAITGSIQDLAGYMYVSVVLTTGLAGMPEYHFSEAGHYQSVEGIARSLAAQIMTAVRNTQPAKVLLTVEPDYAEIYLDNERLQIDKKPFYLYEGTHRLDALAADYEPAGKTIEARAGKEYLLKIKLKQEKRIAVGFNFNETPVDAFLHTQYFVGAPFQTEVPAEKDTAITFAYGDIKTYTVLRPKNFVQADRATYQLQTDLNKQKTKLRVEKQRNILYWSLGAFYISLPIFMILQGITADMASAVMDYRVKPDESVIRKYRALFISSAVMQGITIGLGINYIVQLGLYLYAADQSIPKEARPQ